MDSNDSSICIPIHIGTHTPALIHFQPNTQTLDRMSIIHIFFSSTYDKPDYPTFVHISPNERRALTWKYKTFYERAVVESTVVFPKLLKYPSRPIAVSQSVRRERAVCVHFYFYLFIDTHIYYDYELWK